MNQEKVWDEIAEQWSEYRQIPKPGVIEFLQGKKGKILDLGCGSGRHFIKLKGIIYGVDFSEKMLKYAKQKAEKLSIEVRLEKATLDKLPFKDDFFDAAIFTATLQCIETEKKRKKSLQELKRVLKPEAEALITVWSKGHKRVKNKGKETTIPWTVNEKKYYRFYHIYDKEELEQLLKEVGFKILKIWIWENKNIFVIVKKAQSV